MFISKKMKKLVSIGNVKPKYALNQMNKKPWGSLSKRMLTHKVVTQNGHEEIVEIRGPKRYG